MAGGDVFLLTLILSSRGEGIEESWGVAKWDSGGSAALRGGVCGGLGLGRRGFGLGEEDEFGDEFVHGGQFVSGEGF